MLAKAPKVNFEVFLVNFHYTCATAVTLEEAVRKAKNTGFTCNIFRSDNPFQILKTVCPVQGVR